MPRRPKRERALITREGWVLVQDDPYDDAVPTITLEVGDRICRFHYDSTVREIETGYTLTSYVEEDDVYEGGGNGHRPP
jgi:hypothetical protein